MRKNELSDEKIMELLKEGRHFKPKDVGGKLYIVSRVGQNMKGHGRYTDENWDRIKRIEEQHESLAIQEAENTSQKEDASTRHRRIYRATNQLLRQLVIDRGTVKTISCTHVTDGFCTLWTYSRETYTSILMRDLFRPEFNSQRKIPDNESDKRIMRINAEYCAGCTMFEPRKTGKNFEFEWYLNLK